MNFRKATVEDVDALCRLINTENDAQLTSEYIKIWYWRNPFQSCSIIVCEDEQSIQGMASTNNFKLNVNEEVKLVAFPQKVLTSQSIRGKGNFSKLYFYNEKDNLENEKVDFFLTFTNVMSTPIFLNKFGYNPGISPDIAILPFNPFLSLPKIYTIQEVSRLNDTFFNNTQLIQPKNSIVKDKTYYEWRYGTEMKKEYTLCEIKEQDKIIAYVFFKKVIKKGIPIIYLVDFITQSKSYVPAILNASRKYANSKKVLSLLVIKNELNAESLSKVRFKKIIKNKFNFLVKGKSVQETEQLANTFFNFSFGDLDFI